ncbi:MAG: hypothetical protein MUE44_03795 [Oscillatoriaceae cyanobacterium Prado104]|jgi:hypothetical protein|nr:hypothetical protein [Oscillatoriaceae cyanobacterium Prado104]
MAEIHTTAGNSSIVPAMAREVQDNSDNSAPLGNGASGGEGFLRLTAEEFCRNPIEIIKRVMLRGDRILLQQAGEDVAAIVLDSEFHKLDDLMFQIKPSQFGLEEEEYYVVGTRRTENGYCFRISSALCSAVYRVCSRFNLDGDRAIAECGTIQFCAVL